LETAVFENRTYNILFTRRRLCKSALKLENAPEKSGLIIRKLDTAAQFCRTAASHRTSRDYHNFHRKGNQTLEKIRRRQIPGLFNQLARSGAAGISPDHGSGDNYIYISSPVYIIP
jgi:hypothetical protein